jgi:hypothetical protein
MDGHEHELVKAVNRLGDGLNSYFEWLKSHSGLATKHDLEQLGIKIMSAIADFAAKQNAFNDRIDTAITDLQGDVQALNDQITALQTSAGQVTPEDQALLDGIQTRAEGITAKLEALDALTPPKPPVA